MNLEEWKNYVKETIDECSSEFGNINTVANIRHIDKSTLYKWHKGITVPRVSTFLKVFPEYNFAGIDQCHFENRGARTKCDRPLPNEKKEKVVIEKPEPVKHTVLCSSCIHNPLCKYKEAFEKTNDILLDSFENAAKGMPFAHAYMVCDYFKDEDF